MRDFILADCVVCGRAVEARGLCHACYERNRRNGTLPPKQPRPSSVERFLSKVAVTDACWLWAASLNKDGYGQFKGEQGMVKAHRWSYQWFVGTIPEGLTIDHLCRVRHCVNPDHLEVVTQAENVRRNPAYGTETHCVHGHERTERNTAWVRPKFAPHRTWRKCKDCDSEAQRKLRARRREAAWT